MSPCSFSVHSPERAGAAALILLMKHAVCVPMQAPSFASLVNVWQWQFMLFSVLYRVLGAQGAWLVLQPILDAAAHFLWLIFLQPA
jgi:hypothetical protein